MTIKMKTKINRRKKVSKTKRGRKKIRGTMMVELKKIGGVGNDNFQIGQVACQRISHK